ncbi:hypothetical protein OBBRIDRAFT_803308 [Obba rivulosa]|uniref:Uncharacterized protein n=1 Tax=Obba rivulosa TaxID=1052685 RepID=A0A8E2B0G1_9APHY|nr:hypothetical protein OBBRIDRAFT_803308 [Obba rivulosa]
MGRRAKYLTLAERNAAAREYKRKNEASERCVPYFLSRLPGGCSGRARRRKYNALAYARRVARKVTERIDNDKSSLSPLPSELPDTLVELACWSLCDDSISCKPRKDKSHCEFSSLSAGRTSCCDDVCQDRRDRARICRIGRVDEFREDGRRVLLILLQKWEDFEKQWRSTEDIKDTAQARDIGTLARRIYSLWEDLHLLDESDAPRSLLCLQALQDCGQYQKTDIP